MAEKLREILAGSVKQKKCERGVRLALWSRSDMGNTLPVVFLLGALGHKIWVGDFPETEGSLVD
jgi:hypothetical protein